MKSDHIGILPANIARSYIAFSEADPKEATRKMELMLDVFKQTVHFFGCFFLSEYLWDAGKNNDKINTIIRKLTRPSLGTWNDLVRTYISKFGNETWLEGIYDAYKNSQSKMDNPYHGRFRNEDDKSRNPFDMMISLRNQIAHGAQYPDNKEAEEILQAYYGVLDHILTGFYPVFERYKVVKCNEVEEIGFDEGYSVFFDIICYEEKKNENVKFDYPDGTAFDGMDPDEFFSENGFYMIDMGSNGSRVFRFSEMVVEILENEYNEDFYLFDGLGNSKVTYIGVREKRAISDYLDVIRHKFTSRGAKMHFDQSGFTMDGFRSFINELTSIAIENHSSSRKYNSDVYVKRACDEYVDEFMNSDKTTMLVTAEAGVGKTNFLCHIAEKLINDGEKFAVYFFNGASLTAVSDGSGGAQNLFRYLERECLEDGSFQGSAGFLRYIDSHNENKTGLVLIVDAVNEAYDVISILEEIDHITSGEYYPWLKIIASIRETGYRILENYAVNNLGKALPFQTGDSRLDRYFSVVDDGKTQYELKIKNWNFIQVSDAYNVYRSLYHATDAPEFSEFSVSMQSVLSNPLNMRLYFETYSSQKGKMSLTEMDLFAALSAELSLGENDCTLILQERISDEMFCERINEIDSDKCNAINDEIQKGSNDQRLFILSPIQRLFERGIVYEHGVYGRQKISFVYQKYLEYLLYEYKTADNLSDLISQIIETRSWSRLPEMQNAAMLELRKNEKPGEVIKEFFTQFVSKGIDPESYRDTIINYVVEVITGETYSRDNSELISVFDRLLKYRRTEWLADMLIRLEIKAFYEPAELIADGLLGLKDIPENIRWTVLFQKSMICQRQSRFEEAEKLQRECIDSKAADQQRDQVIIQLSRTLRKSGDIDGAREILRGYFDNTDRDNPYYDEALIQRGLCDVAQNEFEKALSDYLEAEKISLRKKDYYMWNYNQLGIALVYQERPDYEKAMSVLKDMYDSITKYGYLDLMSDCLYMLASVSIMDGKDDLAEDYSYQAIKLFARSKHYEAYPIMYRILRIVEYRRGNIDKAEEMLNTAQKFKEYCLDKGVLTVCNKLDALIVEKAADMPIG